MALPVDNPGNVFAPSLLGNMGPAAESLFLVPNNAESWHASDFLAANEGEQRYPLVAPCLKVRDGKEAIHGEPDHYDAAANGRRLANG